MKEDKFDHIIKGKIEELEVPFNAAHWEDLDAQLDQLEGGPAIPENHDFDSLVFDKLNRLSANDQLKGQTWNVIVQELGQFAAMREQILRFKMIEAILVSLLLLLVVRFGIDDQRSPFGDTIGDQPQAYHQIETTPSLPSISLPKELRPSMQVEQALPLIVEKTDGLSSLPEVSGTGLSNMEENVGSATANSTLSALETLPQQGSILLGKNQEENLGTLPLPTVVEVADEDAFYLLAGMETPQLASMNPLADMPSNFSFLTAPRKSQDQISMFGGGEYNYISTPESADGRFEASNRFSIGYRGGLLIDKGLADSRWRFGSGLIYTAKQYGSEYQRLSGSALRGFTGESLEQIEQNILNIPVFARYDFLKKNRWSLFTQAGISMQVAFQSNYYVGLPDLPQPTLRGANVDITPRSTSGIKERTGGILEGESFRESSFFTGNFALGFERSMTDRIGLFMQSKYEYSIGYFSQGLGPTQDRINTISLETGIRVKLK